MSQLVSCAKSIVTHNINLTEPVSLFNPHQSIINCAIWNHNNQVIASCGNDGTIFLSRSQKEEVLLELKDETMPSKPILSVCFTSNSQFLASGSQDGLVKIWDLKKKGLQNKLKGHFSQVNCVSWNNTDSLIASCSNAGEIIIHDQNTQLQTVNFTLNAKTPGFKCVKFSPLRKSHIISGSNDGSLTVWDITLREQVAHFNAQHSSKVTAIACSLFNENLVCSSGIDQKVNFYDLSQKSVMRTLQCDTPLTALAFHNDGHSIAVGTLYGPILIYDLRQTQQPKKLLKGHENTSVNYLEFVRPTEEEKISMQVTKKESVKQVVKDENQQPTIKSSINMSMETDKKLDISKTSISALEEIKRETLQRLEQSKLDKTRLSTQKPPFIQQSQVSQVSHQKQQNTDSAQADKVSQAGKDSAGKSFSQIKQTFENYSGKIEDLNKKYDRNALSSERKMESGSGGGFTEEQKKYLNDILNEQLISMKHYVADQIGCLHIDMIRQFQIQQNDFQSLFDRYLYDQNLLTQRIHQLEQENGQLKRTSY